MKGNREDLGAILQISGRFAIAPHLPGGLVTPAQLRTLADVAEKYRADACKVTSAQRIAIIGIDEDEIVAAWGDLGMEPGAAIGMCVRSVKICPGNRFCRYAQQDTIQMGLELDKRFHGRPTSAKFKIAVSGCTRQCAENCIRDFGLMGFKDGWRVTVGGNGGAAPRLAQPLARGLSNAEALELCEKVVNLTNEEQIKGRIGKWIEKIGIDEFRARLGLSPQDGVSD